MIKIGRRNLPERYVFLFDQLIVLCKPNNPRRDSKAGPVAEYKLKEKFLIKKVEVVDREDTEGNWSWMHLYRVGPKSEYMAKSYLF